jgi:hypothetical protein
MAAAVTEAVALCHEITDEIGAEIPDADPDKRHAILDIRAQLQAAGPELSVGNARIGVISARLGYLASKESTVVESPEVVA